METIQYYPLLLKREIDEAVASACKANGCAELQSKITVIYSDALTRAAGMAHLLRMEIKLSIPLLRRCDKAEQIETVVHEVCHLIAHAKYRNGGHGVVWKLVMSKAGYPHAKRCHEINREGLRRTGSHSHHTFRCRCKEHKNIGPIVAKRIAEGRKYRCKLCRQFIFIAD